MTACNKNSMTYWYPLISNLPIPQPRTIIVKLAADYWDIMAVCDGDGAAIEAQMDEIQEACGKIGTPLFLRTDYTSGKHSWNDTCYVPEISKIRHHISELIVDTSLKELSIEALVFREYIQMDSKFTAFYKKMPVNPERRYFIHDGVQCHHAYWIEEAIADSDEPWAARGKSNLVPSWRELLAVMNAETPEEVKLLSKYALLVAGVLEGYWSVDFCMAKDGTWYLIDCALGDASWHPEYCEYAAQES